MSRTPSPLVKAAPAAAVIIERSNLVRPDLVSTLGDLRLSPSDMCMLTCHYAQFGLFFSPPGMPDALVMSSLSSALSRALGVFPALAGRLVTLPDESIVVRCNDTGAELHHAVAPGLSIEDFLMSDDDDVPAELMEELFPMHLVPNYDGHHRPLASFQVTILGDGAVFVGFAANHAVVDGTSYWHFFNTWAGMCRRGIGVQPPDFTRNFFGDSKAVLRLPDGGASPALAFDPEMALRERIFHFSASAIRELKVIANDPKNCFKVQDEGEVSSFQSLCAHMWRAVTRARRLLDAGAMTTFYMVVNCRHRVQPRVSPFYFGNAIQSAATTATVAELASNDLAWAASRLHATVVGHGDSAIRRVIADWEAAPKCFPLGNPDGGALMIGNSPRFPMYDQNNFGWGHPLAVRGGHGNKFDGKLAAFPGQASDGSIDIEVSLAPDTMACLLDDNEFLHYVSYRCSKGCGAKPRSAM